MKTKNDCTLSVNYQKIDRLKPFAQNARTHSKHQIHQIAESIRIIGFLNPVLVDKNNRIVAGHGRVEAAKLLGMKEVPTIQLDGLSEDQIRAYVIADNKLAENAGWDKEILAIELQHLLTLDSGNCEVTITGFGVAEIDAILGEASSAADREEPVPEPDSSDPVSETGDMWLLRKHKVQCGNSLHEPTYRRLMGSRRAAMVFTDPPYNVRIDGHATGNGSIRHREFQMASGEMTEVEFLSFLNSSLRHLAHYSAPKSVHYICIDRVTSTA